jgi:endoglucanase
MLSTLRDATVRVLAVLLVAGAGWGVANALDPRATEQDVAAGREDAAREAGEDFLGHYVEPDGRVVRRDEGSDVVSEGQAYGLLIAVALGDEARFRSIWDWTREHLRRPDGLLSWRWSDGRVTDPNSAADADLDAARALILAGRRFGASDLGQEGRRLGADLLRAESATVGAAPAPPPEAVPPGHWLAGPGLLTVAGNWATTAPHAFAPGYFSPRAEREILRASADRRWLDVSRTQRVLSWQLVGAGTLPPDWATVDASGHAVPTGPPAGGPSQFGLDAARLPIRFAESCDPGDRSLAASLRPLVASSADVPAIRNLDGSAASEWQHPVALVSAAATEHAAGDSDAAAARMDRATALQERYPTYFGAAWVALGRIMLDTDLLGGCPDGGTRFLQRDP